MKPISYTALHTEQKECLTLFTQPETWYRAPELDQFYDVLNTQLFDNTLPKVSSYWAPPAKRFLGRCHTRFHPKTKRPHAVAIEMPINGVDGRMYETFIHEMVHVYQSARMRTLGHDKLFFSILNNKLKKYLSLEQKGVFARLEPLIFPPNLNTKNRFWKEAPDIQSELREMAELLFDKKLIIPTCYRHSTSVNHDFTLHSYWCHQDQCSKPYAIEVSKKIFRTTEKELISMACAIASLHGRGYRNRLAVHNDLYQKKKKEYFGTEEKEIDFAQIFKNSMNIDDAVQTWLEQVKQKHAVSDIFVTGKTSSGKTQFFPPSLLQKK